MGTPTGLAPISPAAFPDGVHPPAAAGRTHRTRLARCSQVHRASLVLWSCAEFLLAPTRHTDRKKLGFPPGNPERPRGPGPSRPTPSQLNTTGFNGAGQGAKPVRPMGTPETLVAPGAAFEPLKRDLIRSCSLLNALAPPARARGLLGVGPLNEERLGGGRACVRARAKAGPPTRSGSWDGAAPRRLAGAPRRWRHRTGYARC
jgi:hypothetical protein